jgi:hypothetical protein
VEQWHYGHAAKKATRLYAYGIDPPPLRWGRIPEDAITAYVTDGGGEVKRRKLAYVSSGGFDRHPAQISWLKNHSDPNDKRPRLSGKAASATPQAFRDILIAMAESARIAEVVR